MMDQQRVEGELRKALDLAEQMLREASAEIQQLREDRDGHFKACRNLTAERDKALKEVERLKSVIEAQDKLLDYRAARIRGEA